MLPDRPYLRKLNNKHKKCVIKTHLFPLIFPGLILHHKNKMFEVNVRRGICEEPTININMIMISFAYLISFLKIEKKTEKICLIFNRKH
jgi:hypothetical protein